MTASVLSQAPPSGPATPGGGRRVAVVVVAVVVVLAVVAALVWGVSRLGGGQPADTTVDRSREPGGLAALVLLLEAFGATVERGGVDRLDEAAAQPDVVLLVPGTELEPVERDDLDRWVELGGRVVEVGEGAGYAGGLRPALENVVLAGSDCRVDGLADVATIEVRALDEVVEAPVLGGGVACFPPEDGAPVPDRGYVVVAARGDGTVVELGGISPFTNALLDRADNAVLATSLLAPEPGSRVLLLEGAGGLPRAGGGTSSGEGGVGGGVGGERPDQDLPDGVDGDDEDGGGAEDPPGLDDHIPEGIRWGLVQLLVALVVYVAWRGRRVGAPVEEPAPVVVDGSQLVAAVGELLARTRSPERAGELLRTETARLLARRLGLPATTDPLALSAAAAARLGLDEARCRVVLAGPPPHDAEALVALATQLDDLREEIRDGVPA